MTSTPTLTISDFSNTFIIKINASGEGIGEVLQQKGKPIVFMSRALKVSKKPIVFTIVKAVRCGDHTC